MGEADPFHPEKNTEGFISMTRAENKLSRKDFLDKVLEVQKIPPENWTSGYIDFNGHETFRKATASMMERTWIKAPV